MSAPLSPSFDPIAFHARFRNNEAACIDLANGERLTYGEFEARVADAAALLAGSVPDISGARVAVLSRNCADMAVLCFAAERAGAIFTPLNWRLAAAELADILADCTPALILTQPEFETVAREAASLSDAKSEIRPLSSIAGREAKGQKSTPNPAGIDDPCVILYTSGTTGRPKGVVITRGNALYSSLNFSALAAVDAHAVLLCDSPMFHTVGLIAITRSAVLQGACVVLSDRFVPAATLDRLSDPSLGVTHYFVVPQMVEALMKEPAAPRADFSRLKAIFSGGGPLSPALVKTCLDRGVMLVNGYGMSEIGSGIHAPLDRAFMTDRPESVGFPAPYLEVMLAGRDGLPVAAGEVGEIWMRGPSISPGYWGRTPVLRDGWFPSGDLARQEPDGAFVIVDRLKDMYISGGENVYPAEVEAVLRQIEGVEDAVVVGAPDERWGEAGWAFVLLKPGAQRLAEADIRRAVGSRLARYKQPARVVIVDSIPRTGSGKPRKNLLRESLIAPAAIPGRTSSPQR